MNKKMMALFVYACVCMLSCCFSLKAEEVSVPQDETKNEVVLNDEEIDVPEKEEVVVNIDKVSETLGHLLMKQLNNPVFNFNMNKIFKGMKQSIAGKEPPLSEEQYGEQMMAIQEKIFQKSAEKNLNEAVAFLEKNVKSEGVISLNAQLQYKVLEKGEEGKEVLSTDTPLIHYTGKLMDGTVFGSSKDGNPIPLPLKETIIGFNKGIVGMKKGEKRVLYVHPELAYGMTSQLPPNSLLIFEVEVVEPNSVASATAETKVTNSIAEETPPNG
jgi:peptidylprolyl isomerase